MSRTISPTTAEIVTDYKRRFTWVVDAEPVDSEGYTNLTGAKFEWGGVTAQVNRLVNLNDLVERDEQRETEIEVRWDEGRKVADLPLGVALRLLSIIPAAALKADLVEMLVNTHPDDVDVMSVLGHAWQHRPAGLTETPVEGVGE